MVYQGQLQFHHTNFKAHRKMDHQWPPSFYHILMNPSSPHLPLPVKFVKKHLKNRILKKPILKSANGGYLWKLKMKKFDDDSFCFVDGWCKVVKDVGFLFGEFLLVKYVGASVFLMHVYSVNGCEKILAPRTNFKVVDKVSVFEDDEVVFDDDDVEEEDDDDVEYGVDEDDDDEVEFSDDAVDEDDGEDDVDVDGDDGDPYFIITSSKRNKNKLRFPPDLVAMAKIDSKGTITLRNDDGYEKEMPVRSYKQNKSTRYYVDQGWKEFQRGNNISEGDECVLKFITSEDKLCLAKVTKKRTRATKVDNDDEGKAEDAKEDESNVNGDDIFDDEGKGENAKHLDDDEDDEDDDRDVDVDGDDGDPSFILTCSDTNQYKLPFSAHFVALAGIDTKETITLKNFDGYEKELHVRSHTSHRRNQSKSYYLAAGWKEFQQNSNISEGDKFVFKFITSEDKFCVAKITKKRTPARPLPPVAKSPVTKVVDGKDVVVGDNEDKDENVKLVDDGMDVDADDNKDEDKDPEFVVTIKPIHKSKLVLPKDFVVLAGIESKENIIMKSLDGNETKFSIRTDKRHRLTYYYLSAGWPAFKRSNNISKGDKCVFKYITHEDRLCLAKLTKAPPTEVENKMTTAENVKTRSSRRPPPVEITLAEAVKRKRGHGRSR